MTSGIAHEVGNSLGCLSSISHLLKKGDHPSEHLEALDEQIHRIRSIVANILTFARPSSGEAVLSDLDCLVEQTVSLTRYSHRAQHANIRSIRNRDLDPVRLVPLRFQQVVLNLMLNAFDAVNAGRDKSVVIERSSDDGWVSVTVAEHGLGMTQEQLRLAFEPFYTTKPSGDGCGLGLSICKVFVEQDGGRISLDSRPGRGTVARVSYRAAERTSSVPDSSQKMPADSDWEA